MGIVWVKRYNNLSIVWILLYFLLTYQMANNTCTGKVSQQCDVVVYIVSIMY